MTVDHGHLLASDGLDRHAAYVGMSRHRETLSVHYGADDFKDRAQLVRTLGRERAKDTTLDYDLEFAERRGLARSEIHVPRGPAPEVGRTPKRSMFDGLKLGNRPALRPEALEGLRPAAGERAPTLAPRVASDLGAAVDRYARAWGDAERMRALDLPVLEHQKAALRETGQKLEAARPGAVRDFVQAVEHQASMRQALAGPSGPDRARQLVAGLDREARVRADPALAAERLVKTWRGLEAEHGRLQGFGQAEARGRVEARMKALVGELKRDPQLESLMRARSRELGIGAGSRLDQVLQAPTIGQALTRGLSLGRGQGLSR